MQNVHILFEVTRHLKWGEVAITATIKLGDKHLTCCYTDGIGTWDQQAKQLAKSIRSVVWAVTRLADVNAVCNDGIVSMRDYDRDAAKLGDFSVSLDKAEAEEIWIASPASKYFAQMVVELNSLAKAA